MRTTITRANNALPKVTRSKLKPHTLFQVMKDGRASGDVFANLGFSESLGKYFSIGKSKVSRSEGELFGNDLRKGDKEVAVVGYFEFKAVLDRPSAVTNTTRGKLKSGDVFQVPRSAENNDNRNHKPPLYVALGTVNNGRNVLSYNLNTKKLAVGSKLNGHVSKVGVAEVTKTQAA